MDRRAFLQLGVVAGETLVLGGVSRLGGSLASAAGRLYGGGGMRC